MLKKESVEIIPPVSVTLGNGTRVAATKKRTVSMILTCGMRLVLEDVLFCEQMKSNLISVLRVQEKGYKVVFENDECNIYMKKTLELSAKRQSNSFKLNCSVEVPTKEIIALASAADDSTQIWHERLGHFNVDKMVETASKEYIEGIPKTMSKEAANIQCKGSITGKLSNTRFPKHNSKSSSRELEKIHSDVCGPLSPPSFKNA